MFLAAYNLYSFVSHNKQLLPRKIDYFGTLGGKLRYFPDSCIGNCNKDFMSQANLISVIFLHRHVFFWLNCTWADGLIQTSMPMMMMHKLQQSAVYNWLQGGGSDHLQWSGGIRLYNRISSVHSAIPCVIMLFSVGFLS